RGLRAGAVVRTDRGDVELLQERGRFCAVDAARRLAVGAEREECDDRQVRDAADSLDRERQLVELGVRLEDEEVDTARGERLCLLGVPAGADRSGDEDVAPRYLAGLACELDAFAVDLRDVLVEDVR